MSAPTQRPQLLGDEKRLMAIAPREKERRLSDRFHARKLDRGWSGLGSAGYAGITRTALSEMAVWEDAVVPIAPLYPDGIPSDLTKFSDRWRGHDGHTLLRGFDS